MKNVNDFSSFLNEMDINDPILINSRASRDKASRDKAELKKRLAKRVYGKIFNEIHDKIEELLVKREKLEAKLAW